MGGRGIAVSVERAAASAGLVACHLCGLVARPVSRAAPGHCPRCGEHLAWRHEHSLQRTWAFLIAAAILYVPANALPVLTTNTLTSSESDTIMSGVQVLFHKTAVYGVAGLTSAAAAVVLTARLNSAQPTAGTMYELDAIAATVIGGSSLLGGEGTVTGTLIGALIMGVLRNGLNLLNVSSFLQQVVIGVVIIGAVLVDMSLKRQR